MKDIQKKLLNVQDKYQEVVEDRKVKARMNLEGLEPGLKIDLRETLESTESSDDNLPVEVDKWWHNYKHGKEIRHFSRAKRSKLMDRMRKFALKPVKVVKIESKVPARKSSPPAPRDKNKISVPPMMKGKTEMRWKSRFEVNQGLDLKIEDIKKP